ncbi:MAG TPA: M14 family zinc carboxypeptidase [Thermoanaerobaculia bacterium]|nr:M14 family zinc carboxypeptidase [Thermoanaerobaculia bacterium]
MRSLAVLLLLATTAFAQNNDPAYTEAIRKNTTEARFLTELVDHLPASDTVPSPLKFHGYIAGAEGKLTYAADVHRYMRALEAASPRVKVFSLGKSEEGREMIVVAIANEETIAALDRYREITRKLADPRKLTDDEARALIAAGKPMYHATGALHSTETGSPEMLMELAYRLAVEETPFIRDIRDNVITLLTPVLEVDGRERMVDLWRYREKNPTLPTPPLVYWGHYVVHDNNRDQISMGLALSRNMMKAYDDFHPQVMHDLHESVPFMYISTGTGPFNPALDPLMIDEWHRMGFHEMDELTQRGLPGVWVHGFWDGWAPNYLFWLGAGRNTVARFYETFGNRWPTTEKRVVRGASDRTWFRQNPPLPTVSWSLRNNVNYQQSGVLFALNDMARNRERFLQRFYDMGKRSIAKATTEGPAAWVIDGEQKRQGQVRELLSLLQRQGIEVHQADEAFSMTTNWPPQKSSAAADKKAEPVKFAKGSYIVRMDQPYSRLADTLLDVQYVRGEERVYDDTGWTLGLLKNVGVQRVVNPDVLKVKMHPFTAAAGDPSKIAARIVRNNAETDLVRLRFSNPNAKMVVADDEFTLDKVKYPAGTVVIDDAVANVRSHPLKAPRIAILHSWVSTQDEGWWRLALDSMSVPYAYLSTQDVSSEANLRAKYDVILFPPVGRTSSQDLVNGYPPGPALPWKSTELTPNLGGIDETDDMRPGLGLPGVANLQKFVEDGGVLVTSRDTSVFAIEYGLARWVRVVDTNKLKAPGTIVQGVVTDRTHPIARGYDEKIALYYSGSPVFRVGYRDEPPANDSRPSGRGGKDDPDVVQGRPFAELPERPKPAPGEQGFQLPEDSPWNVEAYLPKPEDRPKVVVSFAEKDLLLSGMLEGADEIAGKPAVIDAPRGKGHVILMAINPMWRMNTSGLYALVMNAAMELAQ